MDAGLVKGEGFAVNASIIKADASRQRGVPGDEPVSRDRCGAYYLTPRNAFDQTAWLRLGGKQGLRGDLIRIKSDNEVKAKPELGVAVLEHVGDTGTLGLTYVKGLGVDDKLANPFSAVMSSPVSKVMAFIVQSFIE